MMKSVPRYENGENEMYKPNDEGVGLGETNSLNENAAWLAGSNITSFDFDYRRDIVKVQDTPDFPVIRHRIFNRVFEVLENRQIKFIRSDKSLNFILHRETRRGLMNESNAPESVIEELEKSILADAEKMIDVEFTIDAPAALYYDLQRTGETDLIAKKRAVCIPNFVLNALICNELEKEFERRDILRCEGFILYDGALRLDIDEWLIRRGFFVPSYDRNNLIIGIRVFRYPNDERPFLLRSREDLLKGGYIN
jgi:hypothetical protein